jgi:RNA polymerase sigma-70 factor, ECF subfamily
MDARALDDVYRKYGHSVLRRARALLGNEADANEVLQEVFASLVDRPAQFEGRSSVATWLYSVTTHGCLNRLRNERTRRGILEAHGAALEDKTSEDPERHAMLRQLLASLPAPLADVAAYRYLDGMTHDEIAALLDCSRRHVGDLLERMHAWVQKEAS